MQRLVLWHRTLPQLFEEADQSAVSSEWLKHVIEQVRSADGEVISSLAGTMVAAFEPHQLERVVQLALRLVDEAEAGPGTRIAFGIAAGEVQIGEGVPGGLATGGSAIDRAQLLANQAGASEIVLDVESRDAASRAFLFERAVATGSIALRGETIDRSRPLIRDCRRAVGLLRPAMLAPSMKRALAQIEYEVRATHTQVFALRGPRGVGGRHAIESLRAIFEPPLWLRLDAVPDGLEPLGSLRVALADRWPSAEALQRDLSALDGEATHDLTQVLRGEPPTWERAVRALRILLQAHRQDGVAPWIYANRIGSIDPATLSVFDAIFADPDVVALGIVRMTEAEARSPVPWIRAATMIQLPMLPPGEAAAVAGSILGEGSPSQLAHQIAEMSGGTPETIVEMIRTLVAAGDIVLSGEAFRWRRGARDLSQSSARSLIEERVALLQDDAIRTLEIACAALSTPGPSTVHRAIQLDGMRETRAQVALDVLQNEQFLNDRLQPTSETLRRTIILRMPAARRAEVYRFIGNALLDTESAPGPGLLATIGAYLCEGGDLVRGTASTLRAGQFAAQQGYNRTAVQLAAAAVERQPEPNTREAASLISRAAAAETTTGPLTDPYVRHSIPASENLGLDIVRALKDEEYDDFERLIDTAIAEGGDLTSAQCLRAVSFLARGDLDAARRCLEQAKARTGTDATEIRIELVTSWLQLTQGRLDEAVIHAMEALATAKETTDSGGIDASLRMLSLCYDGADRPLAAARLRSATHAP